MQVKHQLSAVDRITMIGDLDHSVLSFSTVPSLRPALSSTTTATNERIKLGLTETGTNKKSLNYFHYCACFWCFNLHTDGGYSFILQYLSQRRSRTPPMSFTELSRLCCCS